jgi:predicted transposase YdaD
MKFLTVKTKEDLAMIAEKSPVLERAAARLIEVSEDAHTRHRLESYRLFEMDQRVMIKEARAEGKAEGKAEGRAEGKAEGKAEGRTEGRVEGAEEVFSLLEQGYSSDEVKAILAKRRTEDHTKPTQNDTPSTKSKK